MQTNLDGHAQSIQILLLSEKKKKKRGKGERKEGWEEGKKEGNYVLGFFL